MDTQTILRATAHREWPIPTGPWVMAQRWHELLFAHWPIEPAILRPLIPASLPLDTYAGEAWVGVVPFCMSGVRPRALPSVYWLSSFPELNVRTYVTRDDKPGVYFFSLDAANPVAVALARSLFHLPYFNAQMRCELHEKTVSYVSHRTHRNAPPADLVGSYHPIGPAYEAQPGSLAHWLTERYCLYTTTPNGAVYRGDIHHPQWRLQPAEAEFSVNTMAQAHGVTLPNTPPLLHYAHLQEVLIWPLQRVAPHPGSLPPSQREIQRLPASRE